MPGIIWKVQKMAERRMVAKVLVDTDKFMNLPFSTQALYFHLLVRADDDGFIASPKRIVRLLGCTEDDLNRLIDESYVLTFESGVIVIKHWRIHNYIRRDRYKHTNCSDEIKQLGLNEKGEYEQRLSCGQPSDNQRSTAGIPSDNQMTTSGQPNVHMWKPQVRLGKDSIGKDNKKEEERKPDGFHSSPSLSEIVSEFCGNNEELKNAIDAFIEMRKKIRATLTDRALVMSLNRVQKLSGGNESLMVQIFNQSTMNSWKGLFPLHSDNDSGKSNVEKTAEMFEQMNQDGGADDAEEYYPTSNDAGPSDWRL